MKKVIFILAFVFSCVYAQAQTTADNTVLASAAGGDDTKISESTGPATHVNVNAKDIFSQTTMVVKDGKAWFLGLPDVSSVTAYISDASGEVSITRTLDLEKAVLDVRNLSSGIHYITLTTGSHSRKAFMLRSK